MKRIVSSAIAILFCASLLASSGGQQLVGVLPDGVVSDRAGALTAAVAAAPTVGTNRKCQPGSGSPHCPPPPPPPPPPGPVTYTDAFRFLTQATFGPTQADIDHLTSLGDSSTAYGRWIDEQLAIPPSLVLPVVQQAGQTIANPVPLNDYRQDAWFRNAIRGPDQLRQRVALALSEIMVVSQSGALLRAPFATASYYDTLATGALGSFRDLMQSVTLHPAMGVYLSMLGNRKPDPARSIRPDENFARELMQLFTVGLVQLDVNGRVRLDAQGQPIPTYDQSVVEGFANVFTGWTYAGAATFVTAKRTNANQIVPMQVYPEEHSTVSKKLLSYTGAQKPTLPAGQTPSQDLADALDNVFRHPNVAPFISAQLIRKLTASNPSPEYVGRVAAVFNNDGTGQRGDLAAVVRAILLDAEARAVPANDTGGKLKEPLLRLTQLWRAYDAKAPNGRYDVSSLETTLGEAPLKSPSVFNFFSPSYAPTGEVANRNLVAPEAELATEYLESKTTSYFFDQIYNRNSAGTFGSTAILIDITDELAAADNPDALVALLANKLLGKPMSAALETEVRATINRLPVTSRKSRATEALFLVATAPEFAALR